MINEHDCVVLTEDLPAKNLKAGDIGAVVLVHEEGEGYVVEFMNRKLLSDIRGRTEQGDAQSQSELGWPSGLAISAWRKMRWRR